MVILGDSRVGKSTLIKRLRNEDFSPYYIPTLVEDVCEITYNDVNYSVWDIIEQHTKDATNLYKSYCFGATCAIIVVDGFTTFNRLNYYMTLLEETCVNIPIVIAVNKCDLVEVTNKFKLLEKVVDVVFISCKKDNNFDELFRKLEKSTDNAK